MIFKQKRPTFTGRAFCFVPQVRTDWLASMGSKQQSGLPLESVRRRSSTRLPVLPEWQVWLQRVRQVSALRLSLRPVFSLLVFSLPPVSRLAWQQVWQRRFSRQAWRRISLPF